MLDTLDYLHNKATHTDLPTHPLGPPADELLGSDCGVTLILTLILNCICTCYVTLVRYISLFLMLERLPALLNHSSWDASLPELLSDRSNTSHIH